MHVQLHSSATLARQNGSSECHFGTKLWTRPHDVFGIAGSTRFRSLLSKDFLFKKAAQNAFHELSGLSLKRVFSHAMLEGASCIATANKP